MANNGSKYNQFFTAFVASMGVSTVGSFMSWMYYEEYEMHYEEAVLGHFDFEYTIFFATAALASFLSCLVVRWRGPLFALRVGAALTLLNWSISAILFDFQNPLHLTIYLFALACGLHTAPFSLYIGEIAEKEVRGACASLMSFSWKLGTLISDLFFAFHKVRMLCFVFVGISFLHFCLLFKLHEAPVSLVLTDQKDKAKKALLWLRGPNYDVQQEFSQVERTARRIDEQSWRHMFSNCFRLRRIWLMVLGIAFFHELTGVTSAILVSFYVFQAAKKNLEAYICDIIMGVAQLSAILTVVCLVDRIGRRLLLILSAIGVFAAAIYLGISLSSKYINWSTIVALLGYLISFELGYGPLLWVLITEFFPADCKFFACTFTVAIFWLFKIMVATATQTLIILKIDEADYRYGFLFLFYGVIALVGLVFVLYWFRETKRKTFEEIQEIYK